MVSDGKNGHLAVLRDVRTASMTSWWARLLVRLRAGPFARAVATLAGATAVAQAISLAASPLLTRLYTPDDFGIASVFMSFLSLAVGVSALRYDLAIPLPEDDAVARGLLTISLSCVLATTLALAVVVAGFGYGIVEWFNAPGLGPFLWLLPAGLLVAGIHQVLSSWAVRERAYGLLARRRVIQNLGAAATQVGIGVLGGGPIGLLIGEVVRQGAGTASLAALAWRGTQRGERRSWLADTIRAARVYYRYPTLVTGSSILNAGGLFLPPVLLAKTYGTEVAGLFALAQRMVEAPVRLLGQSVGQVYFAEAAAVARGGSARLPGMYFSTAKKLFVVGSVPVLVAGMASPWLFGAIFGATWREAGTVAQALSWFTAVRFVAYPLSQTLNILGRQDLQAGWDVFRLMAALGTILVGAQAGLSAVNTIRLFALGLSISYLVLFLLGAREVSRLRAPKPAGGAEPGGSSSVPHTGPCDGRHSEEGNGR